VAEHFEIDDVIDPAVTRARVVHALRSAPTEVPREGKRRPFVDTW
jgi:acetyl-CoA carboxylase carboxyltransferase component